MAVSNNYRRPVIGYEADVLALGRREVEAFFKAHYGPRNLVISIVGDVNPEQVHGFHAACERGIAPRLLCRPLHADSVQSVLSLFFTMTMHWLGVARALRLCCLIRCAPWQRGTLAAGGARCCRRSCPARPSPWRGPGTRSGSCNAAPRPAPPSCRPSTGRASPPQTRPCWMSSGAARSIQLPFLH